MLPAQILFHAITRLLEDLGYSSVHVNAFMSLETRLSISHLLLNPHRL